MRILIQKYGGTSIRDLPSINNLISHVKKCIAEGNKLVIVVSAMGRMGDPYATDTLIQKLEKVNKEIDPKKKDLIMSCGETISASIISHLLDTESIPSEALMGFQAGILTAGEFTDSEIIDIDVSKILKYIEADKIVVVAGFQGGNKDDEITTLGRGGSDITAVTLGGYLKAERVDIFTDVPGVALIDPNIVPTTRYIEYISYDHMYDLADSGVKVIHPRAVKAGQKFNIPIRIRSSYLADHGTLISQGESQSHEGTVGIGLKEKNNTGVISILFKRGYKSGIERKVEDYLKQNTEGILNVDWYTFKVCIVTDLDKMHSHAKALYHHLFD